MDFNEFENDDSSMDDDDSDEDDNELCDVKSNKSRKANEMNEVYKVARNTHSELQLRRLVSLFILVGTFVVILSSMLIIVNAKNKDDNEKP
jgi:hypothetical protein